MTIIVTGATGFLGGIVTGHLQESGYDVVRTGLSRASREIQKLDITDRQQCRRLLAGASAEVIVHLAAFVDPDACEQDRRAADSINVEGTRNLAEVRPEQMLFVFISTDYVFDGEAPPYSEESVTRPINVYGHTKNLAEEIVRTQSDEHLILRLPLLYSEKSGGGRDLLSAMVRALRTRGAVKLDDWQVRVPTLAAEVASALRFLVETRQRGTFNISSDEPITKYGFACKVAKWINAPTSHLIPVEPDGRSGRASRPRDCHLRTERFRSVGGFRLRDISEAVPNILAKAAQTS